MSYDNSELARAFPDSLRADALRVASILPQPQWNTKAFPVHVRGEELLIPYRIYHDPAQIDRTLLTPLQAEILDCLLTRHHSGYLREDHLKRIVCSPREWVAPFVVQLAGEYVIQILDAIANNLQNVDTQIYTEFLKSNPAFFTLTKQRISSYWTCYHRLHCKEDYAGFKIRDFFGRLAKD